MIFQIEKEHYQLAAKAAGYTLDFAEGRYPLYPVILMSDRWIPWRPIEDDGDSFRLIVKLQIVIDHADGVSWACITPKDCVCEMHDEYNNAEQATRHAVFRAAIEIGKLTP